MTSHRPILERALLHANRFRDSLAGRAPWPVSNASELHAGFDGPTPEVGANPLTVIDALAAAAEPGLTASTGSRFFGWVIGASDPVGVAADLLTSAWGQNAGIYATSPAAAMAEKVAARWLLDILRLPPQSSVGFVTGATMAGFVCLAAARNTVLAKHGWDVEVEGLNGSPRVRVFIGDDAHATIFSALRYLGFGSRVIAIHSDDQGRMDAGELTSALAGGTGPAIVIAQAGQINTGAFDPMPAIVRACRQHGAWLHVDGAFGLWARCLPELTELTTGIEDADSWSVDGHKWLQLPYDSGFAIVRDSQAHRRAMGIAASYLPVANDLEYDPSQFVPELSRRARGFAAWAVLRRQGRQGIADMVRRHCALARAIAGRLAAEPGVRVLNSVDLNQVIVSFGTGTPEQRDTLTQSVIARMREENICLAGGARWHGRRVLRFSIIAGPLQEADIECLAAATISAWRYVTAQSG